jgi:hypothetical protein
LIGSRDASAEKALEGPESPFRSSTQTRSLCTAQDNAARARANAALLKCRNWNGEVSSGRLVEVRDRRACRASRRRLLRGHYRRCATSQQQSPLWLSLLPMQEPAPQTSRPVPDTAGKWRERQSTSSFLIPPLLASPPDASISHSGVLRRAGSTQADSRPRSHRPAPTEDRTRRSKSGRWRGRAASGDMVHEVAMML